MTMGNQSKIETKDNFRK